MLQKALTVLLDYQLTQLKYACYRYQEALSEEAPAVCNQIFQILEIKLGKSAFEDAIAYCQEKLSDLSLLSIEEEKIYKKVLQTLLQEKYIKALRAFCNDYKKGQVPVDESKRIQEMRNLIETLSDKFMPFVSKGQKIVIQETNNFLREHDYTKQVIAERDVRPRNRSIPRPFFQKKPVTVVLADASAIQRNRLSSV